MQEKNVTLRYQLQVAVITYLGAGDGESKSQSGDGGHMVSQIEDNVGRRVR